MVAYLALGVFFVAVVARIIMWIKMPMHVRWELYPVAHEAGKAHYGGSYYEESEWWNQPRQVSLLGELKVMLPEILFLVALKEHNFKLWLRSFPFHFGLYLVVASTALMFATGLINAISLDILHGALGNLIHNVILVSAAAGLVISWLGALGLLQRRLSLHELKDFASPADIFNLVFFVIAFGVALVTFVLVDNDFSIVSGFIANLLTFKPAALPGTGLASILPSISVVLMSLLVAYIPLTHMSHFIGKYFSYHSIRWNDEPNLQGGPQEETIGKMLQLPITWAAPHIKADGIKTWAEVATDITVKENKK